MEKGRVKLNWPLIGNGHIIEFLAKSLANNKVAGSYIFSGPDNLGKTTAAHFLARSLVCQSASQETLPCGKCPACLAAARGVHGDIYLIKKPADKKNISLDQIRDFIRSLSLSSFLNSYKIGIIKGAESLSQGAVNALLKTLEEPKIKVAIILTVIDFEVLPATIVSRSQILRFLPAASAAIYDDLIKNHRAQRSQAKNLSRLAAGRPALALKFLEDKDYLADYKIKVESFVKMLNPDVNERFSAVEDILDRAGGGEPLNSALSAIEAWQNLVRDLILMELDLADLVQHQAFAEDLSAVKSRLSLKALLNFIKLLKQARLYLGANVNPRLALENVAVSI